jgi:hypothetical protein
MGRPRAVFKMKVKDISLVVIQPHVSLGELHEMSYGLEEMRQSLFF